VDANLFDALRALRSELAKAQNVPAYVVFHDATLHELARDRPRTEAELAMVSGIGAHKLARYGAKLLEVVRSFDTPVSAP
jgi:ATP-dependent DNA helicase RecQ